VPLPTPEPGLIVQYSYVFRSRSRNVGDSGKARPCLIVAVFPDRGEPERTLVLYLPISHSPPRPEEEAVEIPANACFAAGLDGARQWILTGEGNLDTWPEDIFTLPTRPGLFHYGFMPPAFFRQVQTHFKQLYAEKKYNVVRR